MEKAALVLASGRGVEGFRFGYDGAAEGESVFSTAMVGYPESLTDPSYSGQLLCVTYPLIGNYGIPEEVFDSNGLCTRFESEKIYVRGLIIAQYSEQFSHYDAVKSLSEWLCEHKVPGICGIDTRELTKILREEGSMLGAIVPEGHDHPALHWTPEDEVGIPVADPNLENQVAIVSCKDVIRYKASGDKKIVLVDCGVKHQILHCFIDRGVNVTRVPWDYDFNTLEWDGLFISNGPGNPSLCSVTVEHIRKAMEKGKPIFGICMGNQLLGIAAGGSTYKLKYGHRSHNQPVRLEGSDKCFISSQNHGFAIDEKSLPEDWEVLFTNMNDGTNEGIRHKSKPFFSAQFHPEASSGPVDTEFLFDRFISLL